MKFLKLLGNFAWTVVVILALINLCVAAYWMVVYVTSSILNFLCRSKPAPEANPKPETGAAEPPPAQ